MYLQTDGDVVEDEDVTREEVKLVLRDPSLLHLLQNGGKDKEQPGERRKQ